MIRFELPLALLAVVPVALVLWRYGRAARLAFVLRAGVALLLVLAWSGPSVRLPGAGIDAIVVVDLSRSMPPSVGGTTQELITSLEAERGSGDRIGVVAFAREPQVETTPDGDAFFGGFTQGPDPDGSDLAAALAAAGELVDPGRAGRILLVSDGRATAGDPLPVARRLAARGIAVDYQWLGRGDASLDVAVLSVDPPSSTTAGEPFRFTATVYATSAVRTEVQLLRNGEPLFETVAELRAGENLVPLADLVDVPGVASYELRVQTPGDGVAENDVGRGVLRVEGPSRVLVLSQQKKATALTAALREAGILVEVRAPFVVDMAALEGVGAVVLENVPADRLGEAGMRVLAQYVRDAGGGLVITGGRDSFGEGGYHKSPIDPVLPVSLELREEQRAASLAMVLTLDRSGSMQVPVRDGRPKMRLATEGSVAALDLLGDRDEAALHVVDEQVHPIFGLQPAGPGLPRERVLSVASQGGGIYVGVALRAAQAEIMKSRQPTRHIILFSDAADSEEPADYRDTLTELRAANVTVSVIGLGTTADQHAKLLQEIAALGGGRIYFANDAESLPRVFSQETIAVARSSFVREPTQLARGRDAARLGLAAGPAPVAGGYNVTYTKRDASLAFATADDKKAPILAFWQHGAGRAAALTAEADGRNTGALREWSGYRAMLEQTVRWTMQRGPAGANKPVARARRNGHLLEATLDFVPDDVAKGAETRLLVLSGDAEDAPVEVPLRWQDGTRLGAAWPLPRSGTYHPVFRLGATVVRAPPVALSYSVEIEPGRANEGRALLASLSRSSGGRERLGARGFFDDAGSAVGTTPLRIWLAVVALVLLFGEIVARRMVPARRAAAPSTAPAVERAAVLEREVKLAAATATAQAAAPPEPPPRAPDGVESALVKARQRAKERLGR